MLFKPKNEKLWDTWLVPHGDGYYLFYLRISPRRDPTSPKPSLGDGWDGISLAYSEDLLHWTELGPVLEKHPDAAWLGTGMIHGVGDQFIMNFSEERPVGYQVVCFARSDDLLHWERMGEEYDLRPDPRFYQREQAESVDPLPRWDSVGVVPPSSGRSKYWGFVCANARGTLPGDCGTLGLLSSEDGLHWQQHPPAIQPGLFPSYEVPEYIAFGDRHYVLFSTNSTAGPRFDPYTTGPHSGCYYVVADHIQGPYVRPPHDPMLFGQRGTTRLFGTYVGRPLRVGEEVLLYHQWTTSPPDGCWGPPKVLVERSPYELGMRYWQGCEKLKARLLAEGVRDGDLIPLKAAGRVPVIDWSLRDGAVVAENRGGTNGVQWNVAPGAESQSFVDLVDGRVLEMDVRIREGRGLGIWVGIQGSTDGLALLLNAQMQAVEVGSLVYTMHGASLLFQPDQRVDWPVAIGVKQHLRVLVRRSFMEIYLDDAFVNAYVSPREIDTQRLGFCSELASGDFLSPCVWAMG